MSSFNLKGFARVDRDGLVEAELDAGRYRREFGACGLLGSRASREQVRRQHHVGEVAGRILENVAETARTLGVPCECQVLTGAEPWREIVRAALDHHADLICMSSHGRHGASEHILASQTARVIEHAHLPVLLFR